MRRLASLLLIASISAVAQPKALGPQPALRPPAIFIPGATATSRGLVEPSTQTFGGNKTFNGSVAFPGGVVLNAYTDATVYGFKPSSSAAANAAALNAAIAATPNGGTVHIDPGTYQVDIGNTAAHGAIPISKSITIIGSGRSITTLQGANWSSGTGGRLFFCNPGVYAINFAAMTLVGPSYTLYSDDFNTSEAIWMGGGMTVHVTDVEFKQWATATHASPEYPNPPGYPGAGSKVYFDNCRFYYYVAGNLHVGGTDQDSDVAEFHKCEWEWDSAFAAVPKNGGSNGQYHATYINQGVAFAVDSSRFISTGGHDASTLGYAFLHYGADSGKARYSRCSNTYFGPGVRAAIHTNANTKTIMAGLTFAAGDGAYLIRPAGDFEISNSAFLATSGAPVYGIVDDQGADVSASITGCRFDKLGGSGFLYGIRRLTGSKVWRISNTVFGDVSSIGLGINAGTVLVSHTDFAGTSGAYSAFMTGGRLVLRDSYVSGTLPVYADTSSAAATLELWGSRWLQSAPTQIQANGHALTIFGGDNAFYESSPDVAEGLFIVSSSGLASISGQLQFGRGVGAYSYSAGTLTLNYQRDTYSINEGGGPTINNIVLTGGTAAGVVAADHLRYTTGRIYLRVKQAFTLGNAGNIVAAGGARTVDSIVKLQYLPSDGKWYEL